jgi:hypothetical protein
VNLINHQACTATVWPETRGQTWALYALICGLCTPIFDGLLSLFIYRTSCFIGLWPNIDSVTQTTGKSDKEWMACGSLVPHC